MDQPRRVGDRIARLIGAAPGTVVMGDTLSIKVYQALASALEMRTGRSIVLSDTGNFPSDLYIADGLLRSLGKGYVLKTVEPEAVADAIDETVAVLMLTHVDYRTGRMHDMKRLTAKAAGGGALVIWDLAHSAGALPVEIAACNADFAVGCTYKYLNGGPGAPAFIYVRPDHIDKVRPALSGWLGHEAPFAFDHGLPPRPKHRAHARRHPAGGADEHPGSRPRHLGRGRHGRIARPVHRADRDLHPRGRGQMPGFEADQPARSGAARHRRFRSSSSTAMPPCRR